MEVWFPDGNGGRKLVNMAGGTTDTEEQTAEVPAMRTMALSRAASAALLAATDEAEDDDGAREIYYPDRDGGRVLLSSGGGITSLPTASQTVKGAVMIGTGLAMNGDTLNVSLTSADLPVASETTAGVIKVGNGLSMDNGTLSVTLESGGTGEESIEGDKGCCCGNVYFAGVFPSFPSNAPYGWLIFVNSKAYIYNGVAWLPFCNCSNEPSTDPDP